MIQSSRVTNVLLAIIAICLLVIAFRPPSVTRPAAAAYGDVSDADRDRLTQLTAADKSSMAIADATRAIATSIDGLARNTDKIAQALDQLGRSVTEMGAKSAESQAAASAAGAATPAPTK